MSIDEWACLVSTHVCNDIVEHHPETSDKVLATVADSIIKSVECLWNKRPADQPSESR